MIFLVRDDFFSIDANVLVPPISCDGIMSKHLLGRFKRKYYGSYIEYLDLCSRKEVSVGKVIPIRAMPSDNNVIWIVGFPLSVNWRDKCTYEDIENGLLSLRSWAVRNNVRSIAMPIIGYGSGKLKFEKIKILIYKHLISIKDLDIYLCIPSHMRKYHFCHS